MMFNFDIDIAIFVIFLLGNLFVGLRFGRKVKNINDYALGGRNFSTGALVSTIVATYISGSGFFISMSKTYSDGLFYLVASACMGLSLVVVAIFLVPKMGEFLGETSVASAMGRIYGREVQFFTGICGILGNVGGIAVQFAVFGNIVHYFLDVAPNIAILASGITVTIYSAFGGIRAVTFTDVLQFITFGFVLPLVGLMIWNDFHSLGISVEQAFNHPKFDYKNVFNVGNDDFWDMIFLIAYFAMPTITSMDFQRISMGKDIHQVRKAMFISAGILVIIKIVMSWVPFLIFNINPNLASNQLVAFIVDNYSYVGLKGLIIVGISAMAMSTADSRINTASVLFANDLYKVFNFKYKYKELIVSKIFSLVLGFASIYLALSQNDLLAILRKSASYYTPIVGVPLFFTILGFRSTKKSVLIAMASGGVMIHVWPLFTKLDPILPAIIVNIIFLFGSHYILKQVGGWQDPKAQEPEEKQGGYLVKKTFLERLHHKIIHFNLIQFCEARSPKNEFAYTGMGIYFVIYTITTMYSTQINLRSGYGDIVLALYQVMMITGVIFTMYPIWPLRIKKEIIIKVWWQFAIFYMLILASSFFVMVSKFSNLQFAIFAANIILAIILTGWKQAIAMIIFGFALSTQAYKYIADIGDIDFSIGSQQFMMMYILALVSVIISVFLKPHQEVIMLNKKLLGNLGDKLHHRHHELEELQRIKNEFLRNIFHEVNTPVTGISSMGKVLHDNYDKMSLKQKKATLEEIATSAERLRDLITNVTDLSKLTSVNYKLNIRDINISEVIFQSLDVVKNVLREDNREQKFFLNIENNIRAEVDEYFLRQAITNLLTNAVNYGQGMPITITLNDSAEEIECSIKDMGVGIPQDELYDIFGAFITSSRTRQDTSGRGIGLAIAKKVINAHNGKIWARNNNGINKGSTFYFVIPKKHVKEESES